jgi:hypothetical protein
LKQGMRIAMARSSRLLWCIEVSAPPLGAAGRHAALYYLLKPLRLGLGLVQIWWISSPER